MKKIIVLLVTIMLVLQMIPMALSEGYDMPFPIPALTGNQQEDFIAVAKSQLGYHEAPDGSTYFAAWFNPLKPTAQWCSEFVAWCAATAGIPTSIIPKGSVCNDYMAFFLSQNRYYHLYEGIHGLPDSVPWISFSNAVPGDILLTETHMTPEDGPDHTAIFLSYDGNKVTIISGNCSDEVKIYTKSPDQFHGLCRPDFKSSVPEQKPVSILDKVTVSGGLYQLNHEELTASFIGPENKNAKKLTIMDIVNANGQDYKVTSIKAKACEKMKNLSILVIGVNVTKIERSAFADCKKLGKITIKCADMKKSGFGSKCFSNIRTDAIIKVPQKKVEKYEPWIHGKAKAPKGSKVKK